MKFPVLCLSIFMFAFSPIVVAQSGHSSQSEKERLHEYFSRLEKLGFAGSLMTAKGDSLEYIGGFGYAKREENLYNTPSTIHAIASVTKTFTAAAILKLQERGKLDTDDFITAYLGNVPKDKQAITIHHLLTHTSGLKRNGLDGGYTQLKATKDSLFKNAMQSELLFEPGKRFEYSNMAYSILAIIIEDLTGKAYNKAIYDLFLHPLGMYQTGSVLPIYYDQDLSSGYNGEKRVEPLVRLPMLEDGVSWNARGNGGWNSNTYDMFRWYRGIKNFSVLDKQKTQFMLKPHIDQGTGDRFYGYGWEITQTHDGVRRIGHRGGNQYWGSSFQWLPEKDRMYFVVTNNGQTNMQRLSETIEKILLGKTYAVPPNIVNVPAKTLRKHKGIYRLDNGEKIKVSNADSTLLLTAQDDSSIAVLLGGSRGHDDKRIKALALQSKEIIEHEFKGNFKPKFEAMDGSSSLETLKRIQGYDRDYWNNNFGKLQDIEIIAAGGDDDFVKVILKINFQEGAGAQIFTWEEDRLVNISVIPDWNDFEMSRTFYPTSATTFETFSVMFSSVLRNKVTFEDEDAKSLIIGTGTKPLRAKKIN